MGEEMTENYTTAELSCKSCQQIYNLDTMTWSIPDEDPIVGTAICDICEPWLEHSRVRVSQMPFWAHDLVRHDSPLIEETRLALEKIVEANPFAQWGVRGLNGAVIPFRAHNHLGPHNDWAWLDVLEWCVGLGHPDIIRGFNHAEARGGDLWMSDEVDTVEAISEWFNQMREEMQNVNDAYFFTSAEGFIYAETHSLGNHEIIIHNGSIVVDDVEFGNRWLDPDILPELLFDSIRGLDTRPIDFRAELYSLNTQCLQFISQVGNIRAPHIPYIRELVNRLNQGDFGTDSSQRFQAALILWSSHPEREFHTCSKDAWAKSFTLVREIANEIPSEVRIEPQGIFVDGASGNQYRISPPVMPGTMYDGFEVRTVSHTSGDITEPICIHTAMMSGHLPMGDILASLILMLRDDIESAKSIGPLRARLAGED